VSTQATDYDVYIRDTGFDPSDQEIEVGDTVWWTNDDDFGDPHSSTSNQGYWDTGAIPFGYTSGLTFPFAGTFPYHDKYFGFQGTIVVKPAPPQAPLLT